MKTVERHKKTDFGDVWYVNAADGTYRFAVYKYDDDDDTIIAGCFEASSNGSPKMSEKKMTVPISLKPIQDETVLGYAHFMLAGIIEKIKLEKKNG